MEMVIPFDVNFSFLYKWQALNRSQTAEHEACNLKKDFF